MLIGAPLATAISFTGDLSASIAFSPDGKVLAAADGPRTMLWDVARRRRIGAPLFAGTSRVYTLALSGDDSLLATGGRDHSFQVWDVSDDDVQHGRRAVSLRSSDTLYSVAFSPDGAALATGGWAGRIWDVATHRVRGAPLPGDASAICNIAFSPDGTLLASGSVEGKMVSLSLPMGL